MTKRPTLPPRPRHPRVVDPSLRLHFAVALAPVFVATYHRDPARWLDYDHVAQVIANVAECCAGELTAREHLATSERVPMTRARRRAAR